MVLLCSKRRDNLYGKSNMDCTIKNFISSIFAGIMIGIAGLIYVNLSGTWYAAILFSVGLAVICVRQYHLYTGKIGYVDKFKQIPYILLIIIGNLIGVFLVSLTSVGVPGEALVTAKLANPLWLVLFKAIGCGFLMYVAVDIYKQNQSLVGVFCCIPAFILAGFEHSIADMFFVCVSGIFNLDVIIFICTVLIGNAIGSFLHKILER